MLIVIYVVFWRNKSFDFILHRKCCNTYCTSVKINRKNICSWFWMSHLLLPHKNVAEKLLQHKDPRPHKSFKTQGAIKKLGRSSPPTIQPRSCSLTLLPLWRSQRCLLLEKVWECWWGCWRSGCKYKFQTDTKKGQILFFVIGTRLLKVDGDYAEKWGV